jgi:hypothetical protein
MTGRILHEPGSPPHTCAIPGGVFGVVSTLHREGTVWECDCETVWVVVRVPAADYGTQRIVAHNEWRRETRKQRRSRLGLHWWQREAR